MKLPVPVLDRANAVEHPAGATIFRAGDDGDEMFIVDSGEVDIMVAGTVVETVGPDGFFGELALIDQAPRSADALARSACRLLRVNRHQFTFMVDEVPLFALKVMKVMADRLRRRRGDPA